MNEYKEKDCVTFNDKRTKDQFGGLSNFASGFPLKVGDLTFKTPQHLLEVCKFPDHPDVQDTIVKQVNQIFITGITKDNLEKVRADWDDVKDSVMEWILTLKYTQHEAFKTVLEKTGSKTIVNRSGVDKYWGAAQLTNGKGVLVGTNKLGELLTKIRDEKPTEVKSIGVKLFGKVV